ncbi:MAG: TetR/AcrR family transcriptional regulator, partial [Chloroflexota bacterium]
GTIYNYFPNKRQLFFAMLESIENPVLNSLTTPTEPYDLGSLLNDLIHDGRAYLMENGPLLRSICAEVLLDEELRAEFFVRIVQPRLELMQNYLRRIDGYGQMDEAQLVTLSQTLLGGVLSNLLFEQSAQLSSLDLEPAQLSKLLTAWLSDGVHPI